MAKDQQHDTRATCSSNFASLSYPNFVAHFNVVPTMVQVLRWQNAIWSLFYIISDVWFTHSQAYEWHHICISDSPTLRHRWHLLLLYLYRGYYVWQHWTVRSIKNWHHSEYCTLRPARCLRLSGMLKRSCIWRRKQNKIQSNVKATSSSFPSQSVQSDQEPTQNMAALSNNNRLPTARVSPLFTTNLDLLHNCSAESIGKLRFATDQLLTT